MTSVARWESAPPELKELLPYFLWRFRSDDFQLEQFPLTQAPQLAQLQELDPQGRITRSELDSRMKAGNLEFAPPLSALRYMLAGNAEHDKLVTCFWVQDRCWTLYVYRASDVRSREVAKFGFSIYPTEETCGGYLRCLTLTVT
jgi:hypothetical protein